MKTVGLNLNAAASPEIDELLTKIVQLESELAERDGDDPVDTQQHDHGKSASSSGGGKGYQQKRSGWVPKVSIMLSAIFNKDWDYVKKIADKWYGESAILRKLVDQKANWT